MSALDRLAERMFGGQRLETTAAMASVDTQTYIGVATSDSADGSVSVVLSDDVTQPDNGIWDGDTFLASDELGTSVELPTTTAVREGDRVLVTASGANVLTAPVVTGVVGRGDEQQAQIDAAAEAAASVEGIAQEALDVAEATGQHFWSDTDGIHVTEVTEEEWSDSTGPSYHSGQNVLVNALGQLFRKGVDNLMALFNGSTVTETVTPTSSWYEVTLDSRPSSVTCTMNGTPLPSTDYKYPYGTDGVLAISNHSGDTIEVTYRVSAGMSLYDGQGNADGNITASFTDTLVRIGRSSVRAVVEFCGGMADLAYRGTSVILRSKTGSAGIQSGTKDLYSSTQAALMVSTLRNIYDGDTNIDLNTAKPRIFAIADSVYLLDTSDPYTLKKEVDMYSLIKATNCRSEGVVTMWAGTKVMTVNASSFTLFTKAELQAIVGTSWAPTGSNCSVFVMNGDHGVSANMMSASIDASSVVRVHMNATRNGPLRVNYLIVRIGG